MILSILFSVCGLVFEIRKMRLMYQNFGFSNRFIEIVIWFYVFFISISVFFLKLRALTLILVFVFLNLLLHAGLKLANFSLSNRLQEQILPFLDQLVLGLQCGLTFRASFLLTTEQMPRWERKQFQQIYSFLLHPAENMNFSNTYFLEMAEQLLKIDQSQSKCIEQIKQLRRNYKIEIDFRRRSGQVMQQIRMQALVVGILYVALLIFIIIQFGFYSHWRLILFSNFLLFVGQLWIFLGGRKIQWKV